MTGRLVVVGGDAAGMSAAATARRHKQPDALDIVAFELGDYTSYSACGLPYFVADEVAPVEKLIARSPEEHRKRDIDMRTRHEVVGIDLDARQVTVFDHAQGVQSVEGFDQLVIATGASPIRPPLPGVDAKGVHGIQTVYDGIALRDHVERHLGVGSSAVVVGGGYVGLEMAEALCRRGFAVTIVDAGEQPMSTLDPDMGTLVADAIRGLGIHLHSSTRVDGFEVDDNGHVRGVVTADGLLAADIVVLGIGVTPNSSLAADAGIGIGGSGGIATDRRMATSAVGVWAAGDCVETFHLVSRAPVAVALGTHANKQGRVVGVNATGGYETFPGVIGTAITKVCEVEIGRTGLNEREAADAGFEVVVAKIEATSRAGYFPDTQPITVKLIAEERTGRMLGAQLVGREGVAKRIDVMAVAIWNEMTVESFAQTDLGYAPPFAPVWDPNIVAANVARSNLRRTNT